MIANPSLFPEEDSQTLIRDWWDTILSEQGLYPSYAFFLFLPSDKEVISYLSNYSQELDFISGKNCLILALNKNKFRRSGVDHKLRSFKPLHTIRQTLRISYWKGLIRDQLSKGYSVRIANYFGISYSDLPCLVVFNDIRSPEHIIISLLKMDSNEIAIRMKTIFSTIQQATSNNKAILIELENLRTKEAFKKGGQILISTIQTIAGKTYQTAIDAWIKSIIK
jgi:hypothetical protein